MKQRDSFLSMLLGAFATPFNTEGRAILIAGALFFLVLRFFYIVPVVGVLASIFGLGYACAYSQKLILSAARGSDSIPTWPDVNDFTTDILVPIWHVWGTAIACLAPSIFYGFISFTDLSWGDPVATGLRWAGVLYFPLALLAVSMTGSMRVLQSIELTKSIRRIPFDYFILSIYLFGIYLLTFFLRGYLQLKLFPMFFASIITAAIAILISTYTLMVSMRILGLLYYTNSHILQWLPDEETKG